MANSALDVLFSRYLNGVPPGGWIDQFDAAGAPVSQSMPASTLYHVFLAFTEALRLGDRLTR
jgi:mannose/cellobiose epimerase-like protein (N-acyl-D-glucosamine 2-epimerase family)